MDIDFRHLIKTLLPGLFSAISVFLIFDLLIVKLINPKSHELLIAFVEKNSTLVASLLIPISLFIGIVLNTVCFVYLIPFIIESHKKKNCKFSEFSKFKNSIEEHLKDYLYNHLFTKNSKIEIDDFKKHVEVNAFLLHRMNIDNLQYIKTSYWYYLEFQLNSIISIIFGVLAISINLFMREIKSLEFAEKIIILFCMVIVSSLVCYILHKAILRNLERDQKKELSYFIGVFCLFRDKESSI
ncbi:MAG TPA: hypothetical protein VFC65_14330 [Prolixibacteraceae bacterium]|nr:hypothetical protein [Prolixibacteraceae bacterium]